MQQHWAWKTQITLPGTGQKLINVGSLAKCMGETFLAFAGGICNQTTCLEDACWKYPSSLTNLAAWIAAGRNVSDCNNPKTRWWEPVLGQDEENVTTALSHQRILDTEQELHRSCIQPFILQNRKADTQTYMLFPRINHPNSPGLLLFSFSDFFLMSTSADITHQHWSSVSVLCQLHTALFFLQ